MKPLNRILLLSALFAFRTLCHAQDFTCSDAGSDRVIFPIEIAASEPVYEDPICAILVTEIVADGVKISPSKVSFSSEANIKRTTKQGSDFFLLFGTLNSLVFLEDTTSENEIFLSYTIPKESKRIKIAYKSRYPNGTFGHKLSVTVIRAEERKVSTSSISLEEIQREAAKLK